MMHPLEMRVITVYNKLNKRKQMIEKASKLISSMVYDSKKNKLKKSYDVEIHDFRNKQIEYKNIEN